MSPFSLFKNLDVAVSELLAKYPDRRIELIDTKGITLGSLSLCIQAGELYLQGKSIDEIIEWSKKSVGESAFYFFADNIQFFKKSGRVQGFAAFMGGMLMVKPIIYIGDNGKMTSIDKAFSRKKAVDKILGYMAEIQDDIKNYPVIIAHCDCLEIAESIASELRATYGDDLKIDITYVNPTAGAHCGPDSVGITFHAKQRTAPSVKLD